MTQKPYGVLSDNHLHNWSAFSTTLPNGLNSRLQDILNEIRSAAEAVRARGGDTLYFAGDLFHVRGSVSPTVLNPAIELFTELTDQHGMTCFILTGNHDLESRDSEALSSACESLRMIEGVVVVSEPAFFPEDSVAMIPWYDSMDRVRDEIEKIKADISCAGEDPEDWTLILHVPVNGVIAGLPDHGFWPAQLAAYGFKRVICGHYHNHRSFPGEVYSVGATTHQTWGDVDTLAGFMIVGDTIEFHESTAPKFIDYDGEWDDDQAIEHCAGNFVRLRLGEATDEEVTMMRDHVMGLGAKGAIVQAIPVVRSAATARTSSVSSAPTVRESINAWIKSNAAPLATDLEKLCEDIMNEAEATTL